MSLTKERIYITAISVLSIGLMLSLLLPLLPAAPPVERPEINRNVIAQIDEYRKGSPTTNFIVYKIDSWDSYVKTVFPDLKSRLTGKPACRTCKWDVGIYYAIKEGRLIVYVIPAFMDDSGRYIDFFNPGPGYEDVYRFKTGDLGDLNEIAYDFGHLSP